jgi:hypothetical protein
LQLSAQTDVSVETVLPLPYSLCLRSL